LKTLIHGLSQIRGGSVLLVLDYAYWEYVTAPDLPDALPLLSQYSRLVILRTFSKIYGLAGLRIGFGVASPELVGYLEKVRQPFNVSSLSLLAAEAALSDSGFVKKSQNLNQSAMRFWTKNLEELGIPFWKSQGNFLLLDVQKGIGMTGMQVYEDCLKKGVIFRPVGNYGLTHALRVSLGTELENRRAFQVLKRLKVSRIQEGVPS
jgi:histidinol-phosphate aminotransferase